MSITVSTPRHSEVISPRARHSEPISDIRQQDVPQSDYTDHLQSKPVNQPVIIHIPPRDEVRRGDTIQNLQGFHTRPQVFPSSSGFTEPQQGNINKPSFLGHYIPKVLLHEPRLRRSLRSRHSANISPLFDQDRSLHVLQHNVTKHPRIRPGIHRHYASPPLLAIANRPWVRPRISQHSPLHSTDQPRIIEDFPRHSRQSVLRSSSSRPSSRQTVFRSSTPGVFMVEDYAEFPEINLRMRHRFWRTSRPQSITFDHPYPVSWKFSCSSSLVEQIVSTDKCQQ